VQVKKAQGSGLRAQGKKQGAGGRRRRAGAPNYETQGSGLRAQSRNSSGTYFPLLPKEGWPGPSVSV